MRASDNFDFARLVDEIRDQDSRAADRLFPAVYDDLRKLARRLNGNETPGATLQPTELVHETYVRLLGQTQVDWQGRTHFFAVAAMAMRRILVDRARARHAKKRGGKAVHVLLDESSTLSVNRDADVLALEETLEKLEEIDPRQAKVVELRFYGGMTAREIAEVIGVSRTTVQIEWRAARAWIRKELSKSP